MLLLVVIRLESGQEFLCGVDRHHVMQLPTAFIKRNGLFQNRIRLNCQCYGCRIILISTLTDGLDQTDLQPLKSFLFS